MKEEQKLEKLLKARFSDETSGVSVNHYSDHTICFTLYYQEGEISILPKIDGKHPYFISIAGEKYRCMKRDNSVETVLETIVDAYYNRLEEN